MVCDVKPILSDSAVTEMADTEWQDWVERGRKDLALAQNQIDVDGEHAAYMAQQALEKHVKALLLRFDARASLKGFGHLPLLKIMEEAKIMLENSCDVNQLTLSGLPDPVSAINACSDDLNSIAKDERVGIAWWKRSLGISLNTEEEKNCDNDASVTMQEHVQNLDNVMRSELQQTKNRTRGKYEKQKTLVRDDLIRTTSRVGGLSDKNLEEQTNSILCNTARRTLAGSGDSMRELMVTRIGCGYYERESDALQFMFDSMLYSSATQNQEEFPMGLRRIVVYFVCMTCADEIILTYPHAQIGRYPHAVDGEKTSALYEKHKEGLRLLIRRVKEACDNLVVLSSTLGEAWLSENRGARK